MRGDKLFAASPSVKSAGKNKTNSKDFKMCFFYDKWDPLFIVFRIIGAFAITRGSNGRFSINWTSPISFYCLIVSALLLGSEIYFIMEKLKILASPKLNFDDTILIGGFMLTQLLQILPGILLWENSKICRFYNGLLDYQIAFHTYTGKEVPKISFMTGHLLGLLSGGAFLVCFVIYGHGLIKLLIEKSGIEVDKPIWLLLNVLFPFKLVVMILITLLWRAWNQILEHCSQSLIREIETRRWIVEKNLQKYMTLWRTLNDLHTVFGRAVGLTYSFSYLLLFIAILQVIFLASTSIIPVNAGTFVSPLFTLGLVTLQMERGCITALKVGEDFRSRLVGLLSSDKTIGNEHELIEFINTIDVSRSSMPLAGFFNFERRIHISMYSSIITYFIIIIQFRRNSQES